MLLIAIKYLTYTKDEMKIHSGLSKWVIGSMLFFLGCSSSQVFSQTAQTYPNKPIKLLIPFPPGGPADGIGRLIAVELTNAIHQSVFVENKGGAGGVIGAENAVQAPADGYTLLLLPSALVANASLYPKLPFNIINDFTSIAGLAKYPLVLVTPQFSQIKSVQELIDMAKAKPSKLNYASAGAGGGAHLAAEEFQRLTGTKFTHIPYKGTGLAVTDTVGGQVNFMFASVESVIELIKAGKLRPLGVTSSKRLPILPDVPTMIELGIKGYEIESWFALIAPKGVPRNVVDYLSKEVGAIVSKREYIDQVRIQGGEPLRLNAVQLNDFSKEESSRWEKIIKETDAKLE